MAPAHALLGSRPGRHSLSQVFVLEANPGRNKPTTSVSERSSQASLFWRSLINQFTNLKKIHVTTFFSKSRFDSLDDRWGLGTEYVLVLIAGRYGGGGGLMD